MKTTEELRRGTAPAGGGADFLAEKSGGLALITPRNARAAAWLRSEVSPESSWAGETLIVEIAYFPNLADAAIDSGFVFEREAYPN